MSSARNHRRPTQRKRPLNLQSLEKRQLLAADIGPPTLRPPTTDQVTQEQVQVAIETEDVNGDGSVSSIDALMVINEVARRRRNGPANNGNATGGNDAGNAVDMDINRDGNVTSLDALQVLNRMRRDRGTRDDGPNQERPNQDRPNSPPPRDMPGPVDPQTDAEIRSIDGTGNNVEHPQWGATGTEYIRLVDSDYADGISEPSGTDRASAREISNAVSTQTESIENDRGLSSLIWVWGQFVDHDIDLTAGGDGESFNIAVPQNDPFFDPQGTGTAEITLTRSGAADGTGVDSPREQTNLITSYLDGSMVYGSSEAVAAGLREFSDGRLATSEGDLLPVDERGFFMAGDVRANENVALTSMHTLWVREHNRIAVEIAASDDSLSDEEIYQAARAIVIGEIQAITFNEYLPALLGRGAISPYSGYDATVDPSISNLFATAAYRYGHTTLTSTVPRLDDDGNEIAAGSLALRDAFFAPDEIIEHGIDSILKGVSTQVSQEVDTQLVDDVRNFLFGPPGSGGFDLASLNIQRGRDHGLPDYNTVRESLGMDRARSFADITSDTELQAQLASVYDSVDDIDLWVGALSEDHVEGASVGPMLQRVIGDQFAAIRDGDRFWYQNVFQGEQLREISRTRLSDVIERNTELTSIQDNAFVVTEKPRMNQPPDRPRDRQTREQVFDMLFTQLGQAERTSGFPA
ncbi:peroxidase family protein [Stieleria varia]|uniref:Peroxidase n=1 Tax=Stieleria varia TaxID=2528005 RepID=A0A5C6BB12_9BACT|nr:peroxidase family protein [Stieleria varia]TWU07704.1 peroxidase [Stieleria varia]